MACLGRYFIIGSNIPLGAITAPTSDCREDSELEVRVIAESKGITIGAQRQRGNPRFLPRNEASYAVIGLDIQTVRCLQLLRIIKTTLYNSLSTYLLYSYQTNFIINYKSQIIYRLGTRYDV